jgi:acyl-coenzyme A synthetase/AMP-(fatty) acid ligase
MQFGVSESVNHWGRYRKDHTAIISNGLSYSYKQLHDRVNIIARNIQIAFPDSKRVSLAIRSKMDLISTIIAVSGIRKSVVLININLSQDALKTNIQDTSTDLLIYDEFFESIGNLYSSLSVNTKRIEELIVDDESDFSFNSFDTEPEDEWGILFSSGTTGTPKGIERDQNSMITELLGWCLELNLSKETVFYVGRPIYYTGGLVLALSNFISGGTIVINDYQSDNDFNEIWEDYQNTLNVQTVNWAFFIPDQIRTFCSISNNLKSKIKFSKKILIMGAPISGSEKREAFDTLKSDIVESWGNTESLGTITEPEDLFLRPDSIGRPFITDELYILGEDLTELSPNKIGRIAGNEEAGFIKYSNRPSETERIKQNKLILSDDLGYIDDEGFFYIKGRVQEKIEIGNKTYYTSEIENEIIVINFISECSILFQGTSSGKGLCIAVTLSEEKSVIEIENAIKIVLENKGIEEFTLMDFHEFPRLTSGKIDKVKLLEMFDE